jgi:hypothetical protein
MASEYISPSHDLLYFRAREGSSTHWISISLIQSRALSAVCKTKSRVFARSKMNRSKGTPSWDGCWSKSQSSGSDLYGAVQGRRKSRALFRFVLPVYMHVTVAARDVLEHSSLQQAALGGSTLPSIARSLGGRGDVRTRPPGEGANKYMHFPSGL